MDNLTDQQHIDALSEPVKDALRRLHESWSSAGALLVDTGKDLAIIPKPSPKRDPVEELAAAAFKKAYAACRSIPDTDAGAAKVALADAVAVMIEFGENYLTVRRLLNMENVK